MPTKKANGHAIPEAPPESDTGTNHAAELDAECFLALQEIDSAVARLGQKKAATIARFENLGVDVEAVRYCQKLDNKDDAPAWIKRIIAMAARLSIIPTETESDGQITLMPGLRVAALDPAAQDKLAVARAHNDGYNTGRHGGSADDNPHQPGTEAYVAWGGGCLDGAADRAIAKANRDDKKARKKAAKEAAEDAAGTVLEQDEAAYRARAAENFPADPA